MKPQTQMATKKKRQPRCRLVVTLELPAPLGKDRYDQYHARDYVASAIENWHQMNMQAKLGLPVFPLDPNTVDVQNVRMDEVPLYNDKKKTRTKS